MSTKNKIIEVVCGVLHHEGKYFAARRKPGKSLAGFWEFPGGKIESNESASTALVRELHEEFGIDVEVGSKLGQKRHDYDAFSICLHGYLVNSSRGDFKLIDHDQMGWFTLAELQELPLAQADVFLLDRLQPLNIVELNPRDSRVHKLVRDLDQYLKEIYPPKVCHMDTPEVFNDSRNHLFGIFDNDELVAMGGVKIFSDYAEIKRMYVRPSHRGRGYSYRVLSFLENIAQEAGQNLLRLETGPKQIEAVALYRSCGYQECEKFGDYEATPLTLFMQKSLLQN